MYGQKQILQCLAVAVILAVFNFHRTIIKRNKGVPRPAKIRRPGELRSKMRQTNLNEMESIYNLNITGYCFKNPFGSNIDGNFDIDFRCPHNCFDKFETWLQKQCEANCCVSKSLIVNATRSVRPTATTFATVHPIKNRVRKITATTKTKTTAAGATAAAAINQRKKLPSTRNCKNTLLEYIENSAGFDTNQQYELVKTIIEPTDENLMRRKYNDRTVEYECKIRELDEHICRNTTSVNVHRTKLEPNKTSKYHHIMEYHDFLFDMGIPEPKPKASSTYDHSKFNWNNFIWFLLN